MRKNETTKNKIIETARELFYENGFNATTFDMIASRLEITKPLITYHFATKAKLGGIVYGRLSEEATQQIMEGLKGIFPDIRDEVAGGVCALLMVDYFKQDEKAFRFYREFFSCSIADTVEGVEPFYNYASQRGGKHYSPEKLHMIYLGMNYAVRSLIYHYVSGEIKCSYEEFAQFYLKINMMPFGETITDYQKLYVEVRNVCDQIRIEVKVNFRMELYAHIKER